MKNTTGITCFIIIALLSGWLFLTEHYLEEIFPFYPLIDTKLPPGFSQAKFESIQKGMTKAEVLKILPTPVPRREYGEEWSISDKDWYYGQDGACLFGDFAWFEFTISFNDKGNVSKTHYEIHRN
jgi:outer membrane protein assembly factor BamE (lipoprotein component of BamABCDE complex)